MIFRILASEHFGVAVEILAIKTGMFNVSINTDTAQDCFFNPMIRLKMHAAMQVSSERRDSSNYYSFVEESVGVFLTTNYTHGMFRSFEPSVICCFM